MSRRRIRDCGACIETLMELRNDVARGDVKLEDAFGRIVHLLGTVESAHLIHGFLTGIDVGIALAERDGR